MRKTSIHLEKYLDELIHNAPPGERLPTVRALMRNFGLSQMVVQRVLLDLQSSGRVESQVGRGTFVLAKDGASVPATAFAQQDSPVHSRTVLLMRRSVSINRGRVLIEKLHQRFLASGQSVLEVSYSDPSHACAILRSLPRFDACVIQSSFKPLPIQVLSAIRDRSDVLAVDGMALIGADVESVGTEWGEPLAEAVRVLHALGHRRIAFAATSQPLLATQLGFRRCSYIQKFFPDISLQPIGVPMLPDEAYVSSLVSHLRDSLDAGGHLTFSALVVWGVEDGLRFLDMLNELGISVPSALSVVLLGRPDLVNEHGGFFETVGCSVEDQAQTLYDAVVRRWSHPELPYGVHLTPVTHRAGRSTARYAERT